ncbi:MAG: preprotein translocase subunit YajC [Thermodesulfovibrionia bacterium]|nr:preprotein translocase subunit YajC [Thermodesulfovibrionia bacterium]
MFSDIAYAMGGAPGGGAQQQGVTGMLTSFLPLVFIFAIFYFLLIRPQSKKAKEHKEVLDNLKKGDKVITSGGIHGIVEEIDGDVLTLKVGVKDDTKVKVSRNFIAGLREKE